jgi:hypothetical protein
MSLSLINEIWNLLQPSLEVGDPQCAAETLVNHLIEEGYSSQEIKTAMRNEYIRSALTYYLESPEGLEEYEEDDYDQDDDDYDEDY